ncbi:hypothetical protein GQR58_030089 [Nymphon striatum]|nr:hypothetical protein GQR58_030089 [Nymphon striatum]
MGPRLVAVRKQVAPAGVAVRFALHGQDAGIAPSVCVLHTAPAPDAADHLPGRLVVTRRVAVVIPALDEEGNVGDVVRGCLANGADWVVVADNGSSDGTAAEARGAGADVGC